MTSTNYDNFSKTFSNSRLNMKWEEIEYFLDYLVKREQNPPSPLYQGGIEQNLPNPPSTSSGQALYQGGIEQKPPSPLYQGGTELEAPLIKGEANEVSRGISDNRVLNILDVWCGNGRLLSHLVWINNFPLIKGEANEVSRGISESWELRAENWKLLTLNYLWIDSSSWLINEAKKLHPNYDFLVLDMKDLDKIVQNPPTSLCQGGTEQNLPNHPSTSSGQALYQGRTEQNPPTPLYKGGIEQNSPNPLWQEGNELEAPLIKGEANEVSRGILEENINKYIPYNLKLKEKSRELRKNMTKSEKKIRYEFLKKIDEKVLRQKPLLDYIVDFYIPSIWLVIEIDWDSHFQADYLKYEEKRTKDLEKYWLEIIRFTNIEVYDNFEWVCENILDKIRSKQNLQMGQEKNPPSPIYKGGIGLEAPLIKGEANEVSRGISENWELKIKNSKLFNYIFFIASFHHLENLEERLEVLTQTKKLLKKWWIIFMTNWDLQSELNIQKYKSSIIKNSKNQFWSQDYSIKIGKYNRFYHSFSLKELEFLFQKSWFQIIENRLFENKKNIVSIIISV